MQWRGKFQLMHKIIFEALITMVIQTYCKFCFIEYRLDALGGYVAMQNQQAFLGQTDEDFWVSGSSESLKVTRLQRCCELIGIDKIL